MHVLHIFWNGERPAVWAEGPMRRHPQEGFAACSATARDLLSTCRECFWYHDGYEGGEIARMLLPTVRGSARPPGTAPRARTAGWKVHAVHPSAANMLMFLSDVRGRMFKPGIFLAPDALEAAELFRKAAAVVAQGRYLPDIAFEGGRPFARWTAASAAGGEAGAEGIAEKSRPFFDWLLDRLVRRASMTVLVRTIPANEKFATFHDAWMAALRTEDGAVPLDRWRSPARGGAVSPEDFAASLAAWKESIRETPGERANLRFELAPSDDGKWTLSAALDARSRPQLLALGQATFLYPPLAGALAAPGGCAAVLSPDRALDFMKRGAHDMRAAGFTVSVPEEVLGDHVSAEAEIAPDSGTAPAAGGRAGEGEKRRFAAKLAVKVDGERVSESELRFLLDQGTSLVYFRDRWIEVDRNVLREALRAMEAGAKKCTLREAAAFAAGGRAGRLRVSSVKARGWLADVLNSMNGGKALRIPLQPEGLVARLRPYQERGAAWMSFLAEWGFGACLADDMGLGKTLQAICALARLRESGAKGPALVFAPLTVLPNWKREFEKFAPGMRVFVHAGPSRPGGSDFRKAAARADAILAPYSLAARDFADLSSVEISAMVLDEAQTIKNPSSRVSRAVRAIDAPVRFALTGTPLENSVTDIWAIEDFLNPGLLGTRADFEAEYTRRGGAAPGRDRLRATLAPFILRRLKTDKGIADELGGKRETREYCVLSPEQRSMYEEALSAFTRGGPAGERPAPGEALALITRLKEICDAPQLAGGEGPSGKADRLEELLQTFFDSGESCLVFTQYAKAGAYLRTRLAARFGRRMPFLHGALSPAAREGEIARFNDSAEPCAFILSLRAGGFGLNLVKATRVVHFDRWWNPAVENQATDRAHRIGQTKDVFVHTFICAGTIEDRVDRILEEKRRLAEEVVAGGETMLLKMTRGELAHIAEMEE